MMFTSYAPYLSTELKGLKGRPDWKGRWEPAIRETTVGRPLPYIYHPSTSGTALHHAFHIASFEDRTRDSVEQMDFVLEFGAGYGSMCRVMFNLGFRGTYVCFDLAPCSALQRYYLKTVGLPVVGPSELKKDGSPAIVCISTYDDLKRLLTNVSDETRSMFIATWSLGESPIAQRDRILPLLSRFRSFLFAYYHRFGEVDNVEFFDTWQATQRNVEWSGSPIEHMPGNTYLMGRRSRRADTSA
jgi:hypothetical protein